MTNENDTVAPSSEKPRNTYLECDALVQAYQSSRSLESSEALLSAFEGYTLKFYNLIRWGHVPIHDRDIREFIKLYMKSKYSRDHIHQYKHMPSVQVDIYKTSEQIRKTYISCTNDELMNEVIVGFLTIAQRYKSPDGLPRFLYYMPRVLHFQLRRQLDELISGMPLYLTDKAIPYHDDYYDEGLDGIGELIDPLDKLKGNYYLNYQIDEIDDNWVLGHTSGEEYNSLTIMERKIIKMYYIDEMSDLDIADSIGTCRATVNRRRNKAIKTLQQTREQIRRSLD